MGIAYKKTPRLIKMTEIDVTLQAFRFLSQETENICRLCFSATDDGVPLDESRLIQRNDYDDTVTFADMLSALGYLQASTDSCLPQKLCEYCADSTINSFLFKILCQQSEKKWLKCIQKLNTMLNMSDTISSTAKTVYLMVQDEDYQMMTSRTCLEEKTKQFALEKIQCLMKSRRMYNNAKKKMTVVCEGCGEKVSSSGLARHMRIHKEEKHHCTQCSKVFLSKKQLQAHTERLHRPKTIQCTKCSKMFGTEKMLKIHNTFYHTAKICKRCFIQFPSRKELRVHLNRHDINKCPRCDKEFQNKNTYKAHLKTCGHKENRQMNCFCDICGLGYSNKSGLKSHLITKHGFGQTYSCKWCKKPFDAISKLKNHIVKHTRERNYHCDQCGGQFVTQAALVYHVRIHTGEKPFPCDMCEESFLSSSRRMEHKRRKHIGPKIECTICRSTFVTNHELKKHVVRHQNPQSRLFVAKLEKNNSKNIKC